MPGTLQLIGVSKTPVRIQTYLVQNQSFMLVNPDIVNNIFIGNDPSSQIISVPPLGSITLDAGKHDVWVSTNGGNYTVQAFLMPNGSNWVPSPAQVAAQIDALGLAKETTQQTGNTLIGNVNSTLGTPAQDGTVSGVNTTLVFGTNPKLDTSNTNTNNTNTSVQNLTTGGTPGGIPPLRGTDNLGNGTNTTLTANASSTLLSNINITKPSFEAVLSLSNGTGSIPFAVLELDWSDSVTGLIVGVKKYVLPCGPAGTPITFYISGPVRGNQVSVKIANRDPAQAMTLSWAVNQTSHSYVIDKLLQSNLVNPNGFTFGAGNPIKGLLFASKPTIAANGTVTRLIAASNAKCKIGIDDGAQANGVNCILYTPSSTTLYDEAAANQVLYRINVAAGAGSTNEIQMPNGPLLIDMINQGASSIIPSVTITAMEY